MNKKKILSLIPVIALLIIFIIIGKELIEIIPHLKNAENEDIKTYLTSFGIKGAIFIILIQAIQILIGFIPSEFVQIASGLTYGTFYGGLLCSLGVLLGASTIWILVNFFKVENKELMKNNNKINEINKMQKGKITKTLFILYFLPAIPYGSICYYGASKKISLRRLVTISLLGTIPSIYLSSLLGNVLLESIGPNFKLILIGIVILLLLSFALTKLFTKKQEEKLGLKDETLVKKPNAFLYYFLGIILLPIFKIKNKVVITNNEVRKLKGPYIMLCTHPSRPDFFYAGMTNFPRRMNTVCARYYFYDKRVAWLLKGLGAIPKNLFNPDIETVKNIINVIKNDGVVLMLPEGRLSASGKLEKMPEGTDKLVKKLNVPVVTVTLHGAHLTGAKWMQKRRRGRIEVDAKVILTSDEIKNNTQEYVKDKIVSALNYNDYEWNATSKVEYKGSNLLKGAENILYVCPHCHKEFTILADKNSITCTNCHTTFMMDNCYQFNNNEIRNINDWFEYQVNYEKEKILSNENYKLETEVILKMPVKDKALLQVGEGTCVLTKDRLTYYGTIDNEQVEKHFSIENIPAMPFGCNEDFELYSNNKFYYFQPKENRKQCVKWSIFAETANNLLKENK